jgi:hypothetical protein
MAKNNPRDTKNHKKKHLNEIEVPKLKSRKLMRSQNLKRKLYG